MRATYRNQAELLLLRSEVENLQRQGRLRLRAIDERLDSLEASVYGQLEPAIQNPPKPSPQERWSVNRDQELRERLRRLELWRLQLEQAKEQTSK